MLKTPRRNGTPWTPADEFELRILAPGKATAHQIAAKLGRTEGAVRRKASEQGIPLKPGPRK